MSSMNDSGNQIDRRRWSHVRPVPNIRSSCRADDSELIHNCLLHQSVKQFDGPDEALRVCPAEQLTC